MNERIPVTVELDSDDLRAWADRHADAGHHGVAHALYQAANGVESITEQHDRETKAEALREAADWLLRIGYVTDITFDIAAPAALWEAFVDAAHRDADGTMHGNSLTRAEVDDWLSVESGRLDAEGETR